MNTWFYILLGYQVISLISIVFSMKTASTDIELWGEEVD